MEDLHPPVVAVGYINPIAVVNGDSGWQEKLAVFRASLSEEKDDPPFRRVGLHPVAVAVHDVNVSVTVEADALGFIELADRIARAAESVQHFSVCIKMLHPEVQ